jgi:hypothetical protein
MVRLLSAQEDQCARLRGHTGLKSSPTHAGKDVCENCEMGLAEGTGLESAQGWTLSQEALTWVRV